MRLSKLRTPETWLLGALWKSSTWLFGCFYIFCLDNCRRLLWERLFEPHFVGHRYISFSVSQSCRQCSFFPCPGDTCKVSCSHRVSPQTGNPHTRKRARACAQVSIGLACSLDFKEVGPFRSKRWKQCKSLYYTF